MADDESIATFNRLIELARDATDGFRAAADAVRDPALARLFATYAQQRADFVRELEDQVRRLGGVPQQRGSVSGAVHRGFINIRAAVSGRDERAMLSEAERGEQVALSTYDEVLQQSLPQDVRNVITRQARRVKETYDALRDLDRAA
jgi:uncharacterized protein (TIGR02284 family)